MRQPELDYLTIDGTRLAVWHWAGSGPAGVATRQILFVHATGFHSRVWDETVAALPPQFDCWAIDMRGHGLSDKPEPPYLWRRFGEDTARAAAALGITNAVGVGHSMGGHSVTLAAALAPQCFAALVLVDPIIFNKLKYTDQVAQDHGVHRRRNHWSSPEAMFESFKGRPPFSSWNERVLADYCRFGLVAPEALAGSRAGGTASGEGGGSTKRDRSELVLACPPQVEGSIYNYSVHKSACIYDELESLSIPVTLLMPGKPEAGVEPHLERHFKNAERVVLEEQSHFIPMEVPEEVARCVRAKVEEL